MADQDNTPVENDDDKNVSLAGGDELIDIMAFDEEAEPEPEIEGSEALEALQAENADLKDRLMRAMAEAENQRKRGERDRRDAEVYGGRKLARDLLSVYDNMQRALDAATDEQREANKSLFEGIDLTQRELILAFSKHKITPIVPEVGDKFDPEIHQAMFEAPVPNQPAGSVIQVMDTGFMIADRLLRPANVGVSSKG